ncbi:MAG: hypothetical protein HBSAPP04_04300 [Ignavibacteriaceae bacterium]|nr:MAG: hypothetical protein HBSAPP04_04300 [Ignavibacteriaceae bacterium]
MIKKFKTFEEARRDLWVMNPDAAYYKRLFELFNLVSKLNKRKYPKGLYKFKTFEEVQKHREEINRQ